AGGRGFPVRDPAEGQHGPGAQHRPSAEAVRGPPLPEAEGRLPQLSVSSEVLGPRASGGGQGTLQGGRLRVVPSLPLADVVKDELLSFRVKVAESARESFNAREGTHDDLLLALPLAVWVAEPRGPSQALRRGADLEPGGRDIMLDDDLNDPFDLGPDDPAPLAARPRRPGGRGPRGALPWRPAHPCALRWNQGVCSRGAFSRSRISVNSSSWRFRTGVASPAFWDRISQPRNFTRKRKRTAEMSRKWTTSLSSNPTW